MFGFEKDSKKESPELKVVFDMELLDRAFEAAVDQFKRTSMSATVMAGASESEAKMMSEMECLKIRCFCYSVKRFIMELSEKE